METDFLLLCEFASARDRFARMLAGYSFDREHAKIRVATVSTRAFHWALLPICLELRAKLGFRQSGVVQGFAGRNDIVVVGTVNGVHFMA